MGRLPSSVYGSERKVALNNAIVSTITYQNLYKSVHRRWGTPNITISPARVDAASSYLFVWRPSGASLANAGRVLGQFGRPSGTKMGFWEVDLFGRWRCAREFNGKEMMHKSSNKHFCLMFSMATAS